MKRLTNLIWLVDDDEDDLMLMQAAFTQVAPNIRIMTLTDGDDLLPQLQTAHLAPSLVVLDLNMPRTGGLETLKIVRSFGQYNLLPVVVLTTSNNPSDQRNSEELGASDFYTKPNTYQALTQLASQLLQQWIIRPVS